MGASSTELGPRAIPVRMLRWLLNRPLAVLGVGAAASAALAAAQQIHLLGADEIFESLYVVLAAAFVALALALMAVRADEPVLRYDRLSGSVALIAAGMLVLDFAPFLGLSVAGVVANGLFAVGAAIASMVILPALYRQMDRRSVTMALFDGGIMISAGTTLALTVWRPDQGSGLGELFMPLVAAAVLASAGVAVIAALNSRMAPALGGVWAGIGAVAVLGLSWAMLVDSAMRGGPRDEATSLVFLAGILLLGYAWLTWSDAVASDERYERVARLLADWMPAGAIVVCVVADALPHGRIDGIDAISTGTAGVVLLSIFRQRLLIVREREASRNLAGEARLRAEKEAAESANRAKSAFLAMMSHEIRTPMNAILGNAALLGEAELGPGERESVEAIESAGQTLLSVINDVLDFSKIEAEKMELERVGFAPATLVRSVVSLFMVDARERGLRLSAEIDPSIPVILAGDPHRLNQILSNLVGNAIKFTSEGGVTVRARVLERTRHHTRLRFEVADTGIGIEPEARGRLFSPFVQVDASTTRRFGGSGLGLAICRSLVTLMGGEIDVDSTPGDGSTFWFTIRLDTPTDKEADGVLENNEYTGRTVDTIGARVLVAEDNEANVRLIERMLGRLGIDVIAVGDGRQAVSAVRESLFDLILMDLHMPEMDGLDATRAIRSAGHDIPIVALTANAMNSDRQACLAAGMNDYLSKPVRATDLSAALHRWLPAGGRAREAPTVGTAQAAEAPAPARFGDVIDERQMAELFALDPDGTDGFFAAMVDSYRATQAETLPQIRAAVAGSDWPLLEEAAHKLKGVAANLGVRHVHDAAARLVAAVRVGDTSSTSVTLADLENALGPAEEALAGLLVDANAASEPDARDARDARNAA